MIRCCLLSKTALLLLSLWTAILFGKFHNDNCWFFKWLESMVAYAPNLRLRRGSWRRRPVWRRAGCWARARPSPWTQACPAPCSGTIHIWVWHQQKVGIFEFLDPLPDPPPMFLWVLNTDLQYRIHKTWLTSLWGTPAPGACVIYGWSVSILTLEVDGDAEENVNAVKDRQAGDFFGVGG